MQSSATVTLRAFVMVACAMTIPVVAISGASWPEIVKKFQNFRFPAILTPAVASSPSSHTQQTTMSPSVPSIAMDSVAANQNADASLNRFAAPANNAAVAASSVGSSLNSVADAPTNPAADRLASLDNVPSYDAETSTSARSDEGIPERLQKLGATYYLLESWGKDQQYRFFCKMSVDDNPDYVHCFEAIESNPTAAMRSVMRQVEAWRGQVAARQPAAGGA